MNKEKLVEVFTGCYKKYKSFLYYSTGFDFALGTIADFEYEKTAFFQKINDLAQHFLVRDKDYFDRIIDQIQTRALPKTAKKETLESNIIDNKTSRKTMIEKVNFFIDMPAELGIVDVFFTLLFARATINNDFDSVAQGGKLESGLFSSTSNDLIESIDFNSYKLFSYYFINYKFWRNSAIATAKRLYEAKKDSTIYSLDLKAFYYSVDIDLMAILKSQCADLFFMSNPDLLFSVEIENALYSAYSKLVGHFRKEIGQKIILPIGCPSSSVVANLYMREFDKKMFDLGAGKNGAFYYSRYVDDILITKEGINEKKSPISDLCASFPTCFEQNSTDNEANLVGYPGLIVQSQKTKIIRMFSLGPRVLLDQLDKEITNSSEVRLMANGDISVSDLAKLVCKEQQDTLLVRDVEIPEISKKNVNIYLSNFLSDRMSTDESINEKETQSTKQISKMLYGSSLLQLFPNWSLILTFAWLMKNHSFYSKLYKSMLDLCDSKYIFSKSDETIIRRTPIKKELNENISLSMKACLDSARARAQSLNIPDNDAEGGSAIYEAFKFRRAVLMNHRYIAVPMTQYLIDDKVPNDLYTAKPETMCGVFKGNLDSIKIRFSPRFVYSSEFAFASYLDIFTSINSEIGFLSKLFEDYQSNVYKPIMGKEICCSQNISIALNDGDYPYVDISDGMDLQREDIYVALASVDLEKRGLLKKEIKPRHNYKEIACNSSYKKKKAIWDLLFSASKKDIVIKTRKDPADKVGEKNQKKYVHYYQINPDIIVFPEFNIPLAWIPELALFARKKQIAIVTGIEYAEKRDLSGIGQMINAMAVIIPSVIENNYKTSSVFIREKNLYAPEEIDRLSECNKTCNGNCDKPYNFLFHWRGLSFAPYVCYELTDMVFRSQFRGKLDAVVSIEWNRNVSYFSNISESLSRDMSVYVVQVNDSDKGGTCIISPMHGFHSNVISIKGGVKDSILIGKIPVAALKEYKVGAKYEKIRKKMLILKNKQRLDENDKKYVNFSAPSANFDKKCK